MFLSDFELKDFRIFSPEEAEERGVLFSLNEHSSSSGNYKGSAPSFMFIPDPLPFVKYKSAFDLVQHHIHRGDTFLLNLTFPTPLDTDLTLEEIYRLSNAKYKLYLPENFVVFSPESFVKIIDGIIFSYPMKGTMDASLPDAERLIMEDEKELREHVTIVDLIRNDLSIVSRDVEVSRFRYVDRLKTSNGDLLQVSSEIRGRLPEDWKEKLGDILIRLLPAGSVSGAPKPSTLNIISRAEGSVRGFFTGVFGYFDGSSLDSAVMIRYIEKKEGVLQFRSGGGITGMSDAMEEYRELIRKVYVPFA